MLVSNFQVRAAMAIYSVRAYMRLRINLRIDVFVDTRERERDCLETGGVCPLQERLPHS